VGTIVEAWKNAYGEDRVQGWIEAHEKSGENSLRNFFREDVVKK
jgi:hypothetical protein